jgi:predicted Zn-dependent peptidase
MRFPSFLLLVALACGVLVAQEPAASRTSGGTQALPPVKVGDHVFHRQVLGNGLRAVAVKAKEGDGCTVFMVVGAGKRQETPETTGLAHLTEHAMYTGTKKTGPGGHDRRIHEIGGESNAFTRQDYTLFYDHKIPQASLGEVLAMEADRLRSLSFNEEAFLVERERLRLEESRTFEPESAREELVESIAYTRHPYAAGVLDDKGHTRAPKLDMAAVRSFYDLHYQPDNVAVVVAGRMDPKLALDAITRAFDHLPRGPKRPQVPGDPKPESPRRTTLSSKLARDRCERVWVVPAIGAGSRPALEVLARLLSRRNLPDGSPVEATIGRKIDQEMFRLAAAGPKAADGLDALMADVRVKGFSEEEIKEAIDLISDDFASLPLRARPYFSLAGTFGTYEVFGHATFLEKFRSAVAAVNRKKILDAAQRHLNPEHVVAIDFKAGAAAASPLPSGRRALMAAAQEAVAAGQLDRAIEAYTKLLAMKSSRMYQVIYLAERGQVRMKQKDYAAAIKDFEAALAIVDYPAVRDLLKEARELQEKQKAKSG